MSYKLQIQSILYNNKPDLIIRSIKSLSNAVFIAVKEGILGQVDLVYGDCSSSPIFSETDIKDLNSNESLINITYEFFDNNEGTAKGHNRLADKSKCDFLLIMNPDVIVSPNIFIELLRPFTDSNIGAVEARQTPIEHPKEYDANTGETSWASTACLLVPKPIFDTISGFDPDTFFLYCDDVDFSWRLRLHKYKVIYQPTAVVFHDKLISQDALWIASETEKYFSAEAAILLAYKYSRNDLVDKIINDSTLSNEKHLLKAVNVFKERKAKNQLPLQIDSNHKVATFIDGNYAKHRYVL
jgi:GT2 family glycosyltransferase